LWNFLVRLQTINNCLLLLLIFAFNIDCSASIKSDVEQALNLGKSVDLLIEYDDTAIEKAVKIMRKKTRNHLDDQETLNFKQKKYSALRDTVDSRLSKRNDIENIVKFKHFPMSHKRILSIAAIDALLAQPEIKAIYSNSKVQRSLYQNLPLINQPEVAFVGEQGQNTTVVVIDDGIGYQNPAFGTCSAPNTPIENCKVIESINLVSNPGNNNTHGTNVAAIIASVAPSTKIAALNIFDANGLGLESDVIAAIDWAIENKAKYNIVAINMSLSDGTYNTSPCTNDWSNNAISKANAMGISVIASSGNEGYTDGLPSPACSPGAISVGAVYDSNIGSKAFASSPRCVDKSTQADKVACFSNSSSNLTLLAPGVMIKAASLTYSGTSQAAPHVAGAVAVLSSTYPNESLDQIQARMTNTGKPITDIRNNITIPRLNLLAAATPINDMFANGTYLTGLTGNTNGTTVLASKELDEPAISGNMGGQSLWWKWTAPQSGQLSLNTNGSKFDSLLAVYTGNQLTALKTIGVRDNTGNQQTDLVAQVTADTEYEFSLDVANGVASSFILNWDLNTNPQANLSTAISGPIVVSIGGKASYTATVTNSGPQAATNVFLTMTAPNGAIIIPTAANCSTSGTTLNCFVGTLANQSSQSFDFQIKWDVITSTTSLTSSASSDLTANSTQSNTITVSFTKINNNTIIELQNQDSADAPSLPDWGIIMLSLTMLLLNLKATRNKPIVHH